jgi:hypothetical protein
MERAIEEQMDMMKEVQDDGQVKSKIRYRVNMLTSMSQEHGKIITAIADSNELEIFEIELVKDMIDFKWEHFAQRSHFIGAFFHTLLVGSMMYYINSVFMQIHDTDENGVIIYPKPNMYGLAGMQVGMFYAAWHDAFQMVKLQGEYFKDKWNYLDIVYILLGYYNIWLQHSGATLALRSRIVFIAIIYLCLMKTFFFLRIVMSYSYIVTMIVNVVADLRVFLLFFAILMVMFSAVFDVIGRAQAEEYTNINPFFANLFLTIRLSLNDFDFGLLAAEAGLTPLQHWLFWAIWILMVLFSSLIFLNFIIAEVSNSYQTVKDDIDALIYKERAGLIDEVENITRDKTLKTDKKSFPKFVVIRETEE